MATGVVSWSQTAASNGTADATVNWAEGMAPSAVNDSARAMMASVAKFRDDQAGSILTTGLAGICTAFSATSNQGFPSLAAMSGQSIALRFHAANAAAATLNVDGLGAKAIDIDGAVAAPAGCIGINSIWVLTYDNSLPGWIVQGLQQASFLPPGIIMPDAGSTAPAGWLACDGSSQLRATYQGLFNRIGTQYGSVDGSHFTLPDLNGRVVAGKEATATRLTTAVGGVDGGTLGAVGGVQGHILTTAQMASHQHGAGTLAAVAVDLSHTHRFTYGTNNASVQAGFAPVNAIAGSGQSNNVDTQGASVSMIHGHTLSGLSDVGNGTNTAHPNVQPTIVLNYIIKT